MYYNLNETPTNQHTVCCEGVESKKLMDLDPFHDEEIDRADFIQNCKFWGWVLLVSSVVSGVVYMLMNGGAF